MIDPVQAVLLVVVVLLALVMIVLGIQVYLILRQVKATLKRFNNLLDNAEAFTENLSNPVTFITGLIASTKSLAPLFKLFSRKKNE